MIIILIIIMIIINNNYIMIIIKNSSISIEECANQLSPNQTTKISNEYLRELRNRVYLCEFKICAKILRSISVKQESSSKVITVYTIQYKNAEFTLVLKKSNIKSV